MRRIERRRRKRRVTDETKERGRKDVRRKVGRLLQTPCRMDASRGLLRLIT